jgi:hypothetical protein
MEAGGESPPSGQKDLLHIPPTLEDRKVLTL